MNGCALCSIRFSQDLLQLLAAAVSERRLYNAREEFAAYKQRIYALALYLLDLSDAIILATTPFTKPRWGKKVSTSRRFLCGFTHHRWSKFSSAVIHRVVFSAEHVCQLYTRLCGPCLQRHLNIGHAMLHRRSHMCMPIVCWQAHCAGCPADA